MLQLAELFEVNTLKEELIAYLTENIQTIEMLKLLKLLHLSEKLKSDQLKAKCIQRINFHAKTIVNTHEWKQLLATQPALVLSIFKLRNE